MRAFCARVYTHFCVSAMHVHLKPVQHTHTYRSLQWKQSLCIVDGCENVVALIKADVLCTAMRSIVRSVKEANLVE